MISLAPFIMLLQMFIAYKYFGRTAWYPGCLVRIDQQIDIAVVIQKRCNIFFTGGMHIALGSVHCCNFSSDPICDLL